MNSLLISPKLHKHSLSTLVRMFNFLFSQTQVLYQPWSTHSKSYLCPDYTVCELVLLACAHFSRHDNVVTMWYN